MVRQLCVILTAVTLIGKASPFAIEHIIIEKPVESRQANGIALGPYGGAMEGVKVEVFDHPELLFRDIPWIEAEKMRHKLGERTTSANGRFSFQLRAGSYEVRLSKDDQLFDPLSYVLVVARTSSKRGACVYMRPESGPGGTVELCDVGHPPEKQ
jgi:hypothetical protein